jgi:hypothetical protein
MLAHFLDFQIGCSFWSHPWVVVQFSGFYHPSETIQERTPKGLPRITQFVYQRKDGGGGIYMKLGDFEWLMSAGSQS